MKKIILIAVFFPVISFGQNFIPISDLFVDTISFTINGMAGVNTILENINQSGQLDISLTYPLTIEDNEKKSKKINFAFRMNPSAWSVYSNQDTFFFANFLYSENLNAFQFSLKKINLNRLNYGKYQYGDIPNNFYYFSSFFDMEFKQYRFENDKFYTLFFDLGVQNGAVFELTKKSKFLFYFPIDIFYLSLIPESSNSFVVERLIKSNFEIYKNYIGFNFKSYIQFNNFVWYFEFSKLMGIGRGSMPDALSPLSFNFGTAINANIFYK